MAKEGWFFTDLSINIDYQLILNDAVNFQQARNDMKKCPFCAQKLQDAAHHCHYCNSMLVDMDGNSLAGPGQSASAREMEWLARMMQVMVTIFFTVMFFIAGLIFLRIVFGMAILEMNSAPTILANILLLAFSVTGGLLISPPIIKWAKQNFARVTK